MIFKSNFIVPLCQQFTTIMFLTMTTFHFPSTTYGYNRTKSVAIENFQQWIKDNCPAFLERFYLGETKKSVYAVSRNNGRTVDYKTTKAIQWQSGKSYPLDQTMVNKLIQLVEDDILLSNQKAIKADITATYRAICKDVLTTTEITVYYESGLGSSFVIETDLLILKINKFSTPENVNPRVRGYKGNMDRKTATEVLAFANQCKIESDAIMAHLPTVFAAIPETFWKA